MQLCKTSLLVLLASSCIVTHALKLQVLQTDNQIEREESEGTTHLKEDNQGSSLNHEHAIEEDEDSEDEDEEDEVTNQEKAGEVDFQENDRNSQYESYIAPTYTDLGQGKCLFNDEIPRAQYLFNGKIPLTDLPEYYTKFSIWNACKQKCSEAKICQFFETGWTSRRRKKVNRFCNTIPETTPCDGLKPHPWENMYGEIQTMHVYMKEPTPAPTPAPTGSPTTAPTKAPTTSDPSCHEGGDRDKWLQPAMYQPSSCHQSEWKKIVQNGGADSQENTPKPWGEPLRPCRGCQEYGSWRKTVHGIEGTVVEPFHEFCDEDGATYVCSECGVCIDREFVAPPANPTTTAPLPKWEDIGLGKCQINGANPPFIFNGNVGCTTCTVQEIFSICTQKCLSDPDCGFVHVGWTKEDGIPGTWCSNIASTISCEGNVQPIPNKWGDGGLQTVHTYKKV